MPHPADLPDLGPSDIRIFGTMKQNLFIQDFITENELFQAIYNFFDNLQNNILQLIITEHEKKFNPMVIFSF